MATVFISAENPLFRQQPLRWNNAQMNMLLHDLRERVPDKNIKLVQFIDMKTGYSEESFKVTGVSIPDMIFLARYYKQKGFIIDGKGSLDIDTMMLNPQIKKYTGVAAYKMAKQTGGVVSFVEGGHAVTYVLDFEHPVPFKLR